MRGYQALHALIFRPPVIGPAGIPQVAASGPVIRTALDAGSQHDVAAVASAITLLLPSSTLRA
jgi:hypothetical protein